MLVLITALVAPSFIEWRKYRSEFEKQAGVVLGQKVEVLGEAKARLLPLPRIIFTNVRVGARENGEPMMKVDRFRVDAELAPLLKGEVVIVDMELQNPRVNIAIGKNGVVDWTDRKTGGFDPDDVLLEKVTIRNGSIRLHNIETNQAFEADQINADISARTLAGPWRVNGDLVLNGEKAGIKITTGRLQSGGTINSRLNVQPMRHPYNVEFSGPVGMVDGALNYKGDFKLKAVQPGAQVHDGEPKASFPYAALPVVISGRFDARPDALKVQEFNLSVGPRDDPYAITGSAQAAFGDRSLFKIVAEGQQIDVDRLGRLEKNNGKIPSLGQRLTVLKQLAEQVPLPPAEGLISLYLPAVVAGDTVIREVGVDILPKKDGWQLSNLEAGLPGRTKLQAHGRLSLGDDFGFNGRLLLASKQPSGFAGWLKGDVDDAIRRLPNAGFSAKVSLNEKRALFEKLEVVLGETRLQGALERVRIAGRRPKLTTNLEGNNVDFETLQALFLLFVSDDEEQRILAHDMDIKLLAENVTAFGVKAGSVAAALNIHEKLLAIEQLKIGNLAGAEISVTGDVVDAFNLPDGKLRISVAANQAQGLIKLAKKFAGSHPLLDNFQEDPALLDDLTLEADIKAVAGDGQSTLNMTILGEAGGTGIDLDLALEGDVGHLGKATNKIDLALVNEQPQLLLRQLAMPVLPIDSGGELQIRAKSIGTFSERLETDFSATLGSATLSGTGGSDAVKGGGVRHQFDVALRADDIDPLLLLSGFSFPGLQHGAAVDISASVNLLGSWLSVKNLKGIFDGQNVAGNLVLDQQATPHPKITGNLDLDVLALDTIAGLVMGNTAIQHGEQWSHEPFTPPALIGLDGEIDIKVGSIDMATEGFGYRAPGEKLTGRLELNNGDIAIRNAKLNWLGGKVSGAIALLFNQQNVLVNSAFNVTKGALGAIVWQRTEEPVANGRFDLHLNAEGSGTTIAEIVANLTGGGMMSVNEGLVHNIDPSALPGILRNADQQADEKLDVLVDNLAEDAWSGKPFRFKTMEAGFSIAGGNVRFGELRANAPGAALSGEARINLSELSLDGTARVTFDAGEEALTGASPEVDLAFSGPLSKPVMRRNSTQLANFLTMRARERKERAYEAQKEEILENQRLVRMVRLIKARAKLRESSFGASKNNGQISGEDGAEQPKQGLEPKSSEQKNSKKAAAVQVKRRRKEQKRQPKSVAKQKQAKKAATKRKRLKKATASAAQVEILPLPPPLLDVRPTGSLSNLPGVFDNVEDKIGAIIKNSQ